MIGQCQSAVDDDTEITGRLLDWNAGRQDGHIAYVEFGKQLVRTQPHELCFTRVKTETNGFQPALNIRQAC